MALCINPACASQGIKSYNGQPGEYCKFSCRQACLGKGKGTGGGHPGAVIGKGGGPLLLSPFTGKGGGYPSAGGGPFFLPGKGGGYPLGKGGGPLPLPTVAGGPAAVPTCKRQGCLRPTWNQQPGEFCSKGCRDAGGSAPSSGAPLQAAGQSSSQSTCTQLSLPNKDLQKLWKQFTYKWDPQRGQLPSYQAVFKIKAAKHISAAYWKKVNSIGNGCGTYGQGQLPGNRQRRFHGSYFTCHFAGQICSNAGQGCPGCGIIRNGFQLGFLGQNTGNPGLFGGGHYSTAMSATAHSYAISGKNRPTKFTPAVLVCSVAVGRAHKIQVAAGGQHMAPLPSGCDSRVIDKGSGVDELVVMSDDQMLPTFVITF